MKTVVELVGRVAMSNVPVLLSGETGTGKEIVAELIHRKSQRATKAMVCLNCAAIPRDLIESELFGALKGSYTGSVTERTGLFIAANNSTIFLDELSEMALDMQAKLLRATQDKAIRRVGSIDPIPVNVRIVAAVNKPGLECVKSGLLREDLYYRLSTVQINVPPLRARREDILPLARAYLRYYCTELAREDVPEISAEIEEVLTRYQWPGNVRQLQNEMSRAALLANSKVTLADFNFTSVLSAAPAVDSGLLVEENDITLMKKTERELIANTLRACEGNVVEASQKLGIGRQTVYNKIRVYGLTALVSLARVQQHRKPRRTQSEPEAPANGPVPRTEVPAAEEAPQRISYALPTPVSTATAGPRLDPKRNGGHEHEVPPSKSAQPPEEEPPFLD